MAVQKRTSTNVLLDTALKNFYAAAEEMGLEDGLVEVMSRPERAICVSIPVQMDDGSVRVFNGYRVQHSTVCGPAKGGLRFHPEVNLEEGEALASLMEVLARRYPLRRRQGRNLRRSLRALTA